MERANGAQSKFHSSAWPKRFKRKKKKPKHLLMMMINCNFLSAPPLLHPFPLLYFPLLLFVRVPLSAFFLVFVNFCFLLLLFCFVFCKNHKKKIVQEAVFPWFQHQRDSFIGTNPAIIKKNLENLAFKRKKTARCRKLTFRPPPDAAAAALLVDVFFVSLFCFCLAATWP